MVSYLVTGGAGFIGSHLCDLLIARGEHVVAVDDLSTGRRANVAQLAREDRFQLVVGCATDVPLMDRLVAEADVVIHLAAAVGVDLIRARPLQSAANSECRRLIEWLASADRCQAEAPICRPAKP